jgi:hypothetical protein
MSPQARKPSHDEPADEPAATAGDEPINPTLEEGLERGVLMPPEESAAPETTEQED